MRWVAGAAAFVAAAIANAEAGEEIKCAAQYGAREQALLEWAAIGGDPHAQYSLAQCAYPVGARDLTKAEKAYALKWLTLAACEASGIEDYEARDRTLRQLKYGSNISFRRFGGITNDETWTAREKKLIEFRDEQIADLNTRLQRLKESAGEEETGAAQAELSDDLARMGPLGLARLAELTTCKAFGASPVYAAAVWQAAADSWSQWSLASVYADPAQGGLDFAKEAQRRVGKLSRAERRLVAAAREPLLRADPARLAALERDAALGRLQDLGFASVDAEGAQAAGRATTTAVQFALEALGFIEFVNGPDNDYGPSTIEAARKAQAAYGKPQTRWLAPEEVRRVVCDAAVTAGDPVSYYHLAMMYAEGKGFVRNLALARQALAKAESLMADRLADKSALPEWKQRTYPEILERIKAAKPALADAPPAALHVAAGAAAEGICR
jgi:TPR repeat protein